jgi:murein DD-endopeptidase MepM/ murein hydrolase activator NlpD
MARQKRFSKTLKSIFVVASVLTIALLFLFFFTTSVTKNTDTYEYQLPFAKGDRHRVVQGYGGLFSHSHIAALDFAMPVGTPIYAARGGVIFNYKNDSDEGGPFSKYKDKANFIIIKHDDGSFGCYWHLKKNGVLIRTGRVAAGQQIGFSGATGFVLRPHLHFSVKQKLDYQMDSYLKTKFKTSADIIFLENGESYERPKQ